MDAATLRNKVLELYPGKRWAQRVSRMTDSQMFAIWASHQERQKQEQEKQIPQEPIKEPEQDNVKLF